VRQIEFLVDAWCERRCLRALREVLRSWPLSSGLTDEWAQLLDALEKVRAFARMELTDAELLKLDTLIHNVSGFVYRK
jgi:hypothetical protein